MRGRDGNHKIHTGREDLDAWTVAREETEEDEAIESREDGAVVCQA